VRLYARGQKSVGERNVCTVRKLPMISRISCALLLVLVGLVVLPTAAQAKVNGGCTATGTASRSGTVDLTTATVWHVTAADVLTGVAKAPGSQRTAQLKVVLFGIGLPLLDRTGSSTTGTAGPYRIADYDPYTRVLAVAGTSTTCDGSVLIIVDDVSPLTTWAGVLGLIAALLGLIGLLATLTQVPTGNARIVGLVVGVVAGLGVGLLLQEMAILDPANALGLLFPAGGAVLGFLVPGLLRSQTLPCPQ
jgi:hypothetical protein